MAGTKAGAYKAKLTNMSRHGNDFFGVIGAKGGRVKGVKKGFAADPARASRAGKIGGSRSTRQRALSDERVDEIIRLYEQNVGVMEIAELLVLNYRTVRKVVENYENV